jgi:hypothetical protein
VWGFDLVMALTIFLVGIIVIYIYAINFLNEGEENLNQLLNDGNLASFLILSEGTPKNWTLTDVEIPGILSEEKINQTKLENLYSLSLNNYTQIKRMLGTNHELYFNFTNIEISGNPVDGIGNSPTSEKNLIKIERFTIYNNKPVKFDLFVWN